MKINKADHPGIRCGERKRPAPLQKLSLSKIRSITLAVLLIPAFACSASAQPRSAKPAVSQQNFEQLKAQADQAREAGNFDEAISLYRRAAAARPSYLEGWWFLATLLYEKDQYAEAAKAFQRTAALQPKVGAPLAMLGLCQFRLGDYDDALKNLRGARKIGIGDNNELGRVMRYHEGVILLLKGEFDHAQNIFRALSYDNVNTENLITAHGLTSLRLAINPSQIARDYRDRDLIRRAGYIEHQISQQNRADAKNDYERLIADYPKTPNLYYAYGRFLLDQRDDEGAVAAFQKEIENSPNHAYARLLIAYIKLTNKEAEAGLQLALEAVNQNNRLPLGRYILGRIYFEMGENAKAIEELETARRHAPNEARIYFALSRAYVRAGRRADAEQARETFTRLNKAAESQSSGFPQEENIEKAKP